MKKFNLLRSILFTLVMSTSLTALEVAVVSPSGQDFKIEVMPEDTFGNVITLLKGYFSSNNEYLGALDSIEGQNDFVLDFTAHYSAEKKASKARDYNIPANAKDKQNISYVINTLGMASLITIAKNKPSIQRAGDKIDHVHPLRFLECIFSDEEMKVSMYNMQDRAFVWKDFMGGLKGSFEKEIQNNNVQANHIQNFSAVLNVDFGTVFSYISAQRWNELVDYLIRNIPRKTKSDHYEM